MVAISESVEIADRSQTLRKSRKAKYVPKTPETKHDSTGRRYDTV